MDDWSPLWISVQVAVLATVCSVILGTALAYGVMKLKKAPPAGGRSVDASSGAPAYGGWFFSADLTWQKQCDRAIFQ
ncbi:MAG: hypothetical protein ACLRPV_13035 [Lacrimispora saccharolytica]